MGSQFDQAKDNAASAAEETQNQAGGYGQAAKDKVNQAGQVGQEKWAQTKQGAADAASAAQQKAGEAKDGTGNVFVQAGNKVKEVVGNLTGNNKTDGY